MPYNNELNRKVAHKLFEQNRRLIEHLNKEYHTPTVAEAEVGRADTRLVDDTNINKEREKMESLVGGSYGAIGGFAKGTWRDTGYDDTDGISGSGYHDKNNLNYGDELKGGFSFGSFLKGVAKIAKPLASVAKVGLSMVPLPQAQIASQALGMAGAGYHNLKLKRGRGKPKTKTYKSFKEISTNGLKKIAEVYNDLVQIDNVDNLSRDELISELDKHLYFKGKSIKSRVHDFELVKGEKSKIKKILEKESMLEPPPDGVMLYGNQPREQLEMPPEETMLYGNQPREQLEAPPEGTMLYGNQPSEKPKKMKMKMKKKLNVKKVSIKKKPKKKIVEMQLEAPPEGVHLYGELPKKKQLPRNLPKRKATPKTYSMSSSNKQEAEELPFWQQLYGQGKQKLPTLKDLGVYKKRGRPSKMSGGAESLARPYNMVSDKGLTGNGKSDRIIGGRQKIVPVAQMQSSSMAGFGKMKRCDVVKKIMKQRGVSMIEASKIVKNENLY